jgi:hypothetical protein
MKTRQKLEVFHWQLLGWNTKLVVKLSHGRIFGTNYRSVRDILRLVNLWRFHTMKRVGAAGVCPYLLWTNEKINVRGKKK